MINPYVASNVEKGVAVEPMAFTELSFKELKTIRDHSNVVTVLGVIWSISSTCWFLGAIYTFWEDAPRALLFSGLYFGVAAIMAVSAYGSFQRPKWARVVCMIPCVFALIGFPLGTILGIIGLIALRKGDVLFGETRYQPKDLTKEFQYRKEYGILD